MKTKYLILLTLFTAAGLSLAGCVNTPEPTLPPSGSAIPQTSDTIKNISVNKPAPTRSAGQEEEFRLPNCAGSAELSYTFSSSQTVLQNVKLGTTVKLSGSVGVDIPAAAKAEITAAVEATYQQELQRIQQVISSIVMKAQPHTDVTYVFQWEDSTYSSIVTFDYSGEPFTAPYTYMLSEPKLSNSYDTACQTGPTSAASPTLTPVPPPPATPDVQTPEGFLRYYFSLVTDGQDYKVTWSLLTPKFQKVNDPGGYDEYLGFWKTIKQVDLNNIEITPLSNTSVDCQFDATFHTLSGITDNVTLKYRLVYNTGKHTWMFDSP